MRNGGDSLMTNKTPIYRVRYVKHENRKNKLMESYYTV